MRYNMMTREMLNDTYKQVLAQYRAYGAMGLTLDMSRGKPHAEQLAFSDELLTILQPGGTYAENGTDARNYGGLDGLPEMKRLFAEILDVSPEEVVVGGNSSLNMMFDCIATLLLQDENWRRGALTFICPSPGYDRHFAMCEYFGINMRPIAMTPDGPDLDAAAELMVNDASVVGMWCVPVFSNPQGIVYTDDTIRRLAAMPAANDSFKLFWDNAYTVHHFRGVRPQPLNILRACEQAGHADRALLFTSFSKISYAGAGVAALAASVHNRDLFRRRLSVQTVGPDKLNQLRHTRYFKNLDGVLAHMDALAAVIRPKFELAEQRLAAGLAGTGAAAWHGPDGGYFLSVDVAQGCAKHVAALCREAGVIITGAGATFPYGNDPLDSNLRLAPTYVAMSELETALDVFCAAVKLAALEKHVKGDMKG